MKTALITGGSQGLGKAIAAKLASLDYKVILVARREDFLKKAVEEIGEKARYFVCDIRDRDQVKHVIEKINKDNPTIDLLVNNAGVWTDDALEKDDPEMLTTAIQTNIIGHVHMTEACLGLLTQERVTRIANVISTAGVLGIPAGDNSMWKAYGASKWGMKGYSNALKEDLRDSNVQVIQFFPGGFESNLYENAGRDNPHDQPWMMKTEDVADVIVFAVTRPDDVYMESIVVSKHM